MECERLNDCIYHGASLRCVVIGKVVRGRERKRRKLAARGRSREQEQMK